MSRIVPLRALLLLALLFPTAAGAQQFVYDVDRNDVLRRSGVQFLGDLGVGEHVNIDFLGSHICRDANGRLVAVRESRIWPREDRPNSEPFYWRITRASGNAVIVEALPRRAGDRVALRDIGMRVLDLSQCSDNWFGPLTTNPGGELVVRSIQGHNSLRALLNAN